MVTSMYIIKGILYLLSLKEEKEYEGEKHPMGFKFCEFMGKFEANLDIFSKKFGSREARANLASSKNAALAFCPSVRRKIF